MFLEPATELSTKSVGAQEVNPSRAELEAEIKEERRLNRQLTERLLLLTEMPKLGCDNN